MSSFIPEVALKNHIEVMKDGITECLKAQSQSTELTNSMIIEFMGVEECIYCGAGFIGEEKCILCDFTIIFGKNVFFIRKHVHSIYIGVRRNEANAVQCYSCSRFCETVAEDYPICAKCDPIVKNNY
jgi:hypothetical protein